MIDEDFIETVKRVNFDGAISYNSNGYAVLPDYEIDEIEASMQPLSKSEIRFLPEGTHYADFLQVYTDADVNVDNNELTLGDYFIYNDFVYKIFSAQNFKRFTAFDTNHIATTIARDNRLTYDPLTNTINLPYPEIDSSYGNLYDLIKMVASCYPEESPLTVLWGFQQELRPLFPYCMVNIMQITTREGTPYKKYEESIHTLYTSLSSVLTVSFKFYGYDKVSTLTLSETFKLNFDQFTFSSSNISYSGRHEENILTQELYENRTIFCSEVIMDFYFIPQTEVTTTQTIDTVAFALSAH